MEFANRDRGYTLIEVLAVAALLVLACSLSVTSITAGSAAEVEEFAHNLAAKLRLLQQKAISSGKAWEVRFYDNWLEIWGPGSTREEVHHLPAGLCWHDIYNPSGRRLGFDALGQPYPGGITLGVTDQRGHTRYIIVAPVLGRVRVDSQPPSP